MVFVFVTNSSAVRAVEPSYGPCTTPGCGGSVDLVEESRTVDLFGCVRVSNTQHQLVFCQKCGRKIMAGHYERQRTLGGGEAASKGYKPATATAFPVIEEKTTDTSDPEAEEDGDETVPMAVGRVIT
eukprot:CAMPEP_0197451294 /NCGR_PEP_ID=MMETSP1175-20131217/28342_1 /TAXON_ID=1003142 /ORGANISM="Triceratium dubium, Strain CCMP147" /LENGTH=126 /DNA_ID=CAMNT_0042983955 /DNA_START=105 /DNA_END=485 /DNA_ORIENTATION=+